MAVDERQVLSVTRLTSFARLMLVLLAIIGLLAWLSNPAVDLLAGLDGDQISQRVKTAGVWGPVLIVSLMTLAVVATPIPSAPIAVAAGAAYGHTMGMIYVVIGAELGAILAFLIARFLGRDVIGRWFGDRLTAGWLGSQNALTGFVFVSRLMPFISFDIVSYIAGLSRLHFWRFAVATLAGIIPASFVLAHFGSETVSGDPTRAIWAAIGLGALTLSPLLIAALRDRRLKTSVTQRNRSAGGTNTSNTEKGTSK